MRSVDESTGQKEMPTLAVLLAAGRGTRMRSETAKVLHEAAGRPLLGWVLEAARAAGAERLVPIVGHQADLVQQAFGASDLEWAFQAEQLGTGHALAQAEEVVAELAPEGSLLLVLSGDVPLLRPETLRRLIEEARRGWGAMAVATLEDPGSLGRVILEDGRFHRIVEYADADEAERAVQVVNAGLYALPAPEVFHLLRRLQPNNAQGEIYLTDALTLAAADGRAIGLVELEDSAEAQGVNNRVELAYVHRQLLERRRRDLMLSGVTLFDPDTVYLDPDVEVEADTVLHSGVSLLGSTRVGSGCEIHQGAWIRDTEIGKGVVVEPYSVLDGAQVESECRVGPFARLRPGTVLGAGAKVGNFVEIKKSVLGPGVKAGHLTYLGDAEIGAETNIGAGTVTCNYDGVRKHRTRVGERAFVGSDTMLVAPVEVGDGAMTAAGSVITQDVAADALGVARGRQRNLDSYAKRFRERAAERLQGEGDKG